MQSYVIIATINLSLIINSIVSEEYSNTFRGFKIPCNDTSRSCLKQSAQAILPDFARGLASLGIDTLDPFIVDKMNISMPGGLSIEFYEGQIKGLRNCIIDSVSVIGNRYKVVLHGNFTIKGKYRSYGKMLMFSVDGDGDATIICKNLSLKLSFKLGTNRRDGKEYYALQQIYDVGHSYNGQVFYKITNLFKGNPEISNMVLEFMNRNWLAVAEEFGDPILNFGIQVIVKNIDKLLSTIPTDELFKLN